MELYKLRKALAAEAKAAGICREWHARILRANSREVLLDLFVRGLDFAISNDFPSDKLAGEFSDLAPHVGVFINQPILDRYITKRLIARDAEGTATFDGFTAGEVYALRGAEVEVIAKANAYVTISVEKGAKVHAIAIDNAKIVIADHGGAFTIDSARPEAYKVITPQNTNRHGN